VLAATIAASVLLLSFELQVLGRSANPSTAAMAVAPEHVSFTDARRIVDRRCAACHSLTPSDVSLGATPAGVAFDTPAQIQALAARIRERAIVQRTMPPGNKTRITNEERAKLARWIADGAQLK